MPAMTTIMSTFDRLREREKQRFREERKGRIPVMDAETLKELCMDNNGYETPELNDSLYAHFQGFQKIEGLEPYYNLKALWLESNGLTKLENIASLVSLRCLYLSKNLIERVENLETLKELNTLDLSENRIRCVTGLACLPQLSSLNLSRNLIESSADLRELEHCTEINNLDISHNHVYDTEVLAVLKALPKLRALRMTGNEVVSKTKYFRKIYISTMPYLSFLDRPIFPLERAGVNAWQQGGNEAELAAKRDFVNKEHEDRRRDLQEFRNWQASVRERRLKEIAAENTMKREQGCETPEERELLETENVDLRGFRGITEAEYLQLDPADRNKWDERIEAAHRDSVKAKYEVKGNGVAQLGAKFWDESMTRSTKEGSAEKAEATCPEAPTSMLTPPPAPVRIAADPNKVTSNSIDELSKQKSVVTRKVSQDEHKLLPTLHDEKDAAFPSGSASIESNDTAVQSGGASKVLAKAEVVEKVAEGVGLAIPVQKSLAECAGACEQRQTWAELEQLARASPFTHKPAYLPSMHDESDDLDGDDQHHGEQDRRLNSQSEKSVGFPIRALTRDELLSGIYKRMVPSESPSITAAHLAESVITETACQPSGARGMTSRSDETTAIGDEAASTTSQTFGLPFTNVGSLD